MLIEPINSLQLSLQQITDFSPIIEDILSGDNIRKYNSNYESNC